MCVCLPSNIYRLCELDLGGDRIAEARACNSNFVGNRYNKGSSPSAIFERWRSCKRLLPRLPGDDLGADPRYAQTWAHDVRAATAILEAPDRPGGPEPEPVLPKKLERHSRGPAPGGGGLVPLCAGLQSYLVMGWLHAVASFKRRATQIGHVRGENR